MAKKRYYQSVKDRMSESRGMERYETKRKMNRYDEYYAGMDERRRMELEDSGMIHEDHRAIANLPQEVMFKEYPKGDYLRYDLDDTIRGVDVQMDDDVRKEISKTHKKYPEKY